MDGETLADIIVIDATSSVVCSSSKPAALRTHDADK